MPALGLSAVPSPTKIRMNSPNGSGAGAAVGDTRFLLAAGPTNDATLLSAGTTRSPLVMFAAGLAVSLAPPSSRRLNGAAGDASRLPTAPSQEDRLNPSSLTTVGAAVFTGTPALAGSTDGVDGD